MNLAASRGFKFEIQATVPFRSAETVSRGRDCPSPSFGRGRHADSSRSRLIENYFSAALKIDEESVTRTDECAMEREKANGEEENAFTD